MSAAETFELVWQQDAAAVALVRAVDGSLGPGELRLGTPTEARVAGRLVGARRVGPAELVRLAADPPANAGATARALFAVVELADRSVSEGLVHPYLEEDEGVWSAFWGATLDASVTAQLTRLAAALPPAAADAFRGDREATVHDLYPVLVDRLARDRLREAGLRLAPPEQTRRTAAGRFLEGLTAPEQALPPNAGYAALARRLSAWVFDRLGRRSEASWKLGLHLEERGEGLALALWLHAADDPSTSLPAALLGSGGDEVFAFLRASDARRDLVRQLGEVEPVLEAAGVRFDPDGTEVELDVETAGRFLRQAVPALEERGIPVLLPGEWLRAPARLRLHLTATTVSSGLLAADSLARFDWRVALGDTTLTEAELAELARSKEPFVRAGGRWHAVRASEVERALRFLERRRAAAGIVDLVRAVAGVETEEAGLELGEVVLDGPLEELLAAGDRRFRALPTPAGMAHDLFPFQERGHGWLRLLGDLGLGGILADDMGLGKTVQAIAMLVSEREERTVEGPTLVVCPTSVAQQWVREVERFAPALRVHLHHGAARLKGEALRQAAGVADVIVTSYDVTTRDLPELEQIPWDRVILDEAQDVKNAQTKRARALRRLPARRRLALTGTPVENRLNELWAIMDLVNPGLLGSQQWFERTLARPIEAYGDERALERLRAIVRPFLLRRAKDDPEVELELPPLTVEKTYCRLTVEQAALYRAVVDSSLPQIERRTDRLGRRGAVLAMLGKLKQVCNHPELVAPTGLALEGRSGKLERLVELLAHVPEGEKSLVFTQYPGFDRLVPHLAERLGTEVGFFHGRLAAARREEVLRAFASPDGPAVLVISLRAGGRGLNLPAANHVFHFDRWWNPAVEQQATDRAHRFGQRRPVWVHSLICAGTLEERIDRLLDSKRELAEKVMAGGGEDWLGDLDLGAIRAAVALAPDLEAEAAAA
jgi:superfamily II DNA or RNA helicase